MYGVLTYEFWVPTNSLTLSLTHLLTITLTYSLTHLLAHLPTYIQTDKPMLLMWLKSEDLFERPTAILCFMIDICS